MNRLADAMSPYLLQHADNPVHWWEWGEEAFAEARRRDVPLLISVGYAACHWCHVMAHESFEDDEVARLVNEHTVPVKVDREERPDVDAVYMTATQAMTGQGGWPMTVFATPDGDPFFCGTYFPKPNFVRLVQSVAKAWREQRDAVLNQGRAVTEALEDMRPAAGSAPLTPDVLDAAAARLHAEHDRSNGGFGGAPKFPPSMCLEFLLRHHARTGAEESLEVVRHTCERMARGGMYDQLAGGFARYSVDAAWVVPHFEKMLYDNALLLRVYTHLWRATGDVLARRVAIDTAWFLVTELATTEGGFASALDADTDGVEGATYVWTPAQLRDVLDEPDAAWAAELFHVTDTGSFEHGTSVLQLLTDPDDPERYGAVVRRLLEARRRRPQPARDDKVVASWNGLAITALLEFSNVCGASGASYKLNQLGSESELSLLSLQSLGADASRGGGAAGAAATPGRDEDTAQRVAQAAAGAAYAAAELLARLHSDHTGRLRRVSRDGRVGEAAGILEDYGAVAEAFCQMHQASGEGVWLERAGALLDTALERFAAPGGEGAESGASGTRGVGASSGFYDTADDAERLVSRPADPTDNATPSGLTALATALISYAALTGSARHREAAANALATVGPLVARHPRFTGWACAAGEALLAGPLEIAIAIPRDGHWNLDPLVQTAWRATSPGAVVVVGEPGRDGVPLLADRSMIDGRPTGYVCRDFTCDLPVVSAADLERQLR